MAELRVEGGELVLAMTRAERFWSLHRDIRVPVTSVRRVRVPSSPWLTMRGWRATGVAVPGWVAMGKRRHGTGYDFSLVHGSTPSLVVELNGQEFGELTVSVPDPVETGRRIADAAGIGFDPTPDRGRLG
jgi:hypothetical protein